MLALVVAACEEGPAPAVDPAPPGADQGVTPPGPDGATPPPPSARARANLRFKGGERLRNDYAQWLGLDPDAVCTELGAFDCVRDVHIVTLGGVEPYVKGIFEPQQHTAVTSPLAVERVALHACGVAIDAADLDFSDPAVRDAQVAALYQRALLLEAAEAEKEHLRTLHVDTLAAGGDDAAWAKLACFAVLTSMEAVFY